MSIDREVNALKEAYSGNPQALRDRYVKSKKLIELLALQSMKSDLDEKQNNIARMMNTNPATIKQQREREVLARTAEDVAQQVGGTLKNMQRQRSQGIQRLAQRAATPQRGLGALMPQQRQRPQKRMMAATGGIVGFETGKLVGPPKTQEEQIQYLIDEGFTDEQIREKVKELGLLPQAADRIIQQIRNRRLATAPAGPMEEVPVTASRLPLATDPPGMMEEVVVTAPRIPPAPAVNPLSAEEMMREQAKTKQTKDKNITEVPVPKDITPEKPAPEKKTYSEPEGVLETLFGEQGFVLPLGLDKDYFTRDAVQYAIDTNRSLRNFSVDDLKTLQDNNQYGPKIEAELARRQSEPKQGIAAVAEEVTATPQTQPPQSKAEGIAAIAEPEIPTADNALVLRSQQNVPAGTSVAPNGSGTAPTEPQEFDLQTALKGVDPVEYTPVDRTGTDAVGLERLKRFGMDPAILKSPEEVGKTAYETAAEQLGITVSDEDAEKGVLTKDAERRKGLADLIEIDKALSDPKRLRNEQLIDFLLGGAGRGRSALAGAGAAAVNRRRAQDRGIRSRQIERNNMVKEIQDANTTLIQSAQARGDTATTRQANIINNAMQTLAQYDEAELAARRTDASNKMQVNIANYERKISEIELLAEQAQNRIQARIDRGDALRDVQNDARDQLEAVEEQFNTLQAEAIRNDAGVMTVDKEIAQELKRSNPDQDRLKALRERRVVEIERVRQEFIIAHPRLYDLRQSLVDTINQLGSQIQSTLGVGSGVSGKQVESAVQRQLQKGIPSYLQPYNP